MKYKSLLKSVYASPYLLEERDRREMAVPAPRLTATHLELPNRCGEAIQGYVKLIPLQTVSNQT